MQQRLQAGDVDVDLSARRYLGLDRAGRRRYRAMLEQLGLLGLRCVLSARR